GGAITAFRSYEANVIGVKTDEDGIVPEALEAALKADPKVKLIYTIATFSNPMGIETTLERRKAMYDLAVKYDVVILEDSPYFELRYSGNYIPSIKSLDKTGHVIFAGSLSKIVTPGVRIGYAIGSKEIMQAFGAEKDNQTINAPGLVQLAVAKYMRKYDLDAHIAEACDLYRKKRDAMLAALEKELGGVASWTHPEGGFFLWLTLPEGVSGDEFSAYVAENQKVIIYPGSMYRPDGKDINAVRLNFSVPTEDQIDECVKRIADGIRDFIK
ncbi:MAG: PLP-dependent aminotransferase family protein, partial [Firmicutes bacterium]|nr:PLP-dependent aminotransferase family protein [Bacillota bacterium]